MTNDLQQVVNSLGALQQALETPYWRHRDFWLNIVVGVAGLGVTIAGLIFSIKAFKEARQAKRAATEAGKTVKIQTVTLELGEISPKLERLESSITFSDARNLLNEISRKIHRITAPFANDISFSAKIKELHAVLDKTKDALNKVRPSAGEEEVRGSTYNAIEEHFAAISNFVADLSGLFEKETFSLRNDNATENRN